VVLGGVVLSVVFVGIALLLNSVIFAENIATRPGVDGDEPVGVRSDTNTTARTSIADINVENSGNRSYPVLESELDARMADWLGMLRGREALSGEWVDVRRTGVTRGWRIMQTNHDRNFTAGGTDVMAGQHTWLVAEDVEQVGVFEQNISRQSTYPAGYSTTKAALADSAYHIAIDEPGTSGFWRIYMFQGVGTKNVYLLTERPDENFVGSTSAYVNFATGTCSYRTLEWVEVEVRAGTFGGAPCEELEFFQELEPGYDIYYNNTAGTDLDGDDINRSKGTYELFVGDADVDGEPFYTAARDESPFRLTALYSAAYEFAYEADDIRYGSHVRARPDRLGTGDRAVPEVSFTYVYDDDDEAYEVDWSVSDADGDLEEVELLLYSNDTDTELDTETVPVSGSSDGGVTTLDVPTFDPSRSYDIYVIVTDEEGVSATETRTHDP
jgi:hypothetical protein